MLEGQVKYHVYHDMPRAIHDMHQIPKTFICLVYYELFCFNLYLPWIHGDKHGQVYSTQIGIHTMLLYEYIMPVLICQRLLYMIPIYIDSVMFINKYICKILLTNNTK